jgi:hypothetical protein
LLPFPSCCFFVVADSHSDNQSSFDQSPVAIHHSLPFCQSLIASRQSLPFNSPVAIRYSLPFSLVGQFAG